MRPPNQEFALTADELRSLRCLSRMMIPASTEHGVPGASSSTILADIVDNLGRDAASVKQGLQHLDALGWWPSSPTETRRSVRRPRRRCRTLVARC